LRWQIELIFKIWKSIGKIHEVKKVKQHRLECYVYAKLIFIVLGWQLLWRVAKVLYHREGKLLSFYKSFKTLLGKYLAQTNPKEAEGLGRFKLVDSKRYAMRLRGILEEKARSEYLKKNDPARYEREIKIRDLERQSRELSESHRQTPDEAARKTMRANLSNVIAQLFDLREMNRQDEVKRMEADLKRLKETLEQRQKNRVNIIERRIQQLTGEAGAMEWE